MKECKEKLLESDPSYGEEKKPAKPRKRMQIEVVESDEESSSEEEIEVPINRNHTRVQEEEQKEEKRKQQAGATATKEGYKRMAIVEDDDSSDEQEETTGSPQNVKTQAEEEKIAAASELAEEEKVLGDEAFSRGNYSKAIKSYTQALSLLPPSTPVPSEWKFASYAATYYTGLASCYVQVRLRSSSRYSKVHEMRAIYTYPPTHMALMEPDIPLQKTSYLL